MTRTQQQKKVATAQKQWGWWVLAVFGLALAVRVAHVGLIHRGPFFDVYMGDALSYHNWGQEIAAGDWVGKEVFYQAPLYPYFLGVIYKILGSGPLAVRLVQGLLGALACVLLADTGRWLLGKGAGGGGWGYHGVVCAGAVFRWADSEIVARSTVCVFDTVAIEQGYYRGRKGRVAGGGVGGRGTDADA